MEPRIIRPDQEDARGKKRSRFWTICDDESKTVQSDAHLADIQEILKSYGVTGMQTSLDAAEDQFMDVSEFTDYADMMVNVRRATVEFMKLPSKIREKFNHDVFQWLDTAHDERRAVVRSQTERDGDPPKPRKDRRAPVEPPPVPPAARTIETPQGGV